MVEQRNLQSGQKFTCLCAPTTHPGSFRCRFHRASDNHWLVPHGASLQKPYGTSKPGAEPASSENHLSETPVNNSAKCSTLPKPPVVCKPVSAVIPGPSRLCNMVSSIGGIEKPCAEAATSTFSKIGFESNSQVSVGSQPSTATREAGVFAVGKCQGKLRKMHSESPPPIFSS
ncbi:hypothetical protein O6H91_10G054900 [Diphasiastrum complanatum]|uniref:Uncharacterized protein n=1 Tax=Diphasiastrum complanatum TaxID=34168 RepID=A0ACC2CHF9_DIPCM|nr:hypothetical protein O6H91_10G054900 [Diphasiastrum complanatum]